MGKRMANALIPGVLMSHIVVVSAALSVIPRPASLREGEGVFTLTAKTRVGYEADSVAAKQAAEYLVDTLRAPTGWALTPVAGPAVGPTPSAITLTTVDADESLGEEGYRLDVTGESVLICARTSAGLFYGMQTVRQLLPPEIMSERPTAGVAWVIPAVTVRDVPRFSWRGALLDCARHFFPAQDVKRYIDQIALYKINTLHLHLTDDQGWRVEIKAYPKLTGIGSVREESPRRGNRKQGDGVPYGPFFYTQEELRDIVAYAASRHITVVPEIELPGHSRAALAGYPELGCTGGPYKVRTRWGVEPDIYCGGNDAVFTFLESMLSEVLDVFPSEFIHIGGDEAPKSRWQKCPMCQARIKAEGLDGEHGLQSYFIRRIETFLNSRGRRLIGWDEILEGGLAPKATVMSWRGIKGGIAAARAGHDVVMSPTSHCYLDYCQARDKAAEPEAIGGYLPLKKVYSYEPVPAVLTADQAKHVLGAQGNVWTEYIHDYAHVQYMSFPRLLALAEVVWSPLEGKDYADFHARLKQHVRHLNVAGVNYRPLDPEPAVTRKRK